MDPQSQQAREKEEAKIAEMPKEKQQEVVAPKQDLAPMEDKGLKLAIITKGKFPGDKYAPKVEQDTFLFLTVMGPTFESVNEVEAKNLAYAARRNFGFDQVGIEHGNPFPIDEKGDLVEGSDGKKIAGYCTTYRLRRSIGTALP
jgi:hypothetical protein